MKIIVVIGDDVGNHDERYLAPDNTTDDQILDQLENFLKTFNSTLRPGESARHIVDVYEDEDADYEYFPPLFPHKWGKTNLVTVMSGRSSYDTYRCEKCGITGKRYSLGGDVRRDDKYNKQKYEYCIP